MDYFTILRAMSTILVVVVILSFLLFLFQIIDWFSFIIIVGISGGFSFLILPHLAKNDLMQRRRE